MTTTKEKYPNEYWAFRLGRHVAGIQLAIEACWTSFEPILEDSPDEELHRFLPSKERWGSVHLKLHDLRHTLSTLIPRDPKVKGAAMRVLEVLDGEVVSIRSWQDRKINPEHESSQQVYMQIDCDDEYELIDKNRYAVRPLIDDLFDAISKHYEEMRVLYSNRSKWADTPAGIDGENAIRIILDPLPIFGIRGWKTLQASIDKVVDAFGERCQVVFDVALQLELRRNTQYIERRLPYYHWPKVTQKKGLSTDIRSNLELLNEQGLDLSANGLSEDPYHGDFSRIEEFLDTLEHHFQTKPVWQTSPGLSKLRITKGVFRDVKGLTWKEIEIKLIFADDAGEELHIHAYPKYGVAPFGGTLDDMGFTQQRNPENTIKAWKYLATLANSGGKRLFRKDKSGKYSPDLVQAEGRRSPQLSSLSLATITKQMSNLGKLLQALVGLPDRPTWTTETNSKATIECGIHCSLTVETRSSKQEKEDLGFEEQPLIFDPPEIEE